MCNWILAFKIVLELVVLRHSLGLCLDGRGSIYLSSDSKSEVARPRYLTTVNVSHHDACGQSVEIRLVQTQLQIPPADAKTIPAAWLPSWLAFPTYDNTTLHSLRPVIVPLSVGSPTSWPPHRESDSVCRYLSNVRDARRTALTREVVVPTSCFLSSSTT